MPFTECNGVRLFYTDEGTGPPVLLVHGFTCDSHDWSYQIPALTPRHRVVAVDLRGHGKSAAPESAAYTPRQFASDLAVLLAQLQTGPVVAVGHSMGGATVVALAVEHPDLVRAVVPVDSAYGLDPTSRGILEPWLEGLAGPSAHDIARDFFLSRFYSPASPPHLRTWHTRRVYGVPQHVLVSAFGGLFLPQDQFGFLPESEAYLRRVTCPALSFRAGTQDPASVAAWERAQFAHPYSRAVAWEGTGHFLHQERPLEFNAILDSWIDGLPG